ncbi:MAG: beta-propeller domain-containing protein, partial [Bdellovibrionota bacterium]
MSQEEQLQRRIGQTEFLNPIWGHDGCGANCQNEPQQDESKQDQKREEQEADIFKIGEAGSKLLYLMNSYRGLQVVSFEDGAENPKLVGRAPSSGYSPNEMYLDEKHDRLIVVETGWYTGEEQTKLSVYDVTDSRRPKITQNVVVTGHVVDSRMVGNVLYVASRKADVGYVTSYSLSKAEITIVQQMKLSLKVSYQKNMNIVVSGEGAATKYYLIATLSEKDWSWWDDASIIEVVDITDPNGRIVPLMSAAARGRVEERTQTSIKNDTLIVTSNYRNKDQPLRIAVETFKLPTAGAEVIDQDEANYRLAHIERQLKGKSGVEYEKLKDKLLGDADLGLRGRFIRAGESLRKIVNDSIVTVGDGSGLHANLQDARYTGDLLYAFWVPQNEIDPFDIFDISHPENGIKHISRLQFDGWIDRAIPFTSQGRRFVLGLGWVVSVVDNEENRRQPQAMLFEVVQSGEKYKAVEIAQLSFKGSNIWADFNDQDKMIEVRFTADGAGEVLFGAQKYKEGAYSAGGQIVRFNAN